MLPELEQILKTSKPGIQWVLDHDHIIKLVEQLKDRQRLLKVEEQHRILKSVSPVATVDK